MPIGDRFAITVAGHRLPLHPTGANGEAVAGVRFRAWQPPECLQPTVGIHTPLVFDVVDTWNHRSVGGCTYHVAHPGGRNYDVFPVNSYEAEARRLGRFFRHGHIHLQHSRRGRLLEPNGDGNDHRFISSGLLLRDVRWRYDRSEGNRRNDRSAGY